MRKRHSSCCPRWRRNSTRPPRLTSKCPTPDRCAGVAAVGILSTGRWRSPSSRRREQSPQRRRLLHRPAACRQPGLLRQRSRANAEHRRGGVSRHLLRRPPDAEPDLLAEPGHDDHGAVSTPPRHDDQRAHDARWSRNAARAAVPGRLRHPRGRQAAPAAHHDRRLVRLSGVGAVLEGSARRRVERTVLRLRHRRLPGSTTTRRRSSRAT